MFIDFGRRCFARDTWSKTTRQYACGCSIPCAAEEIAYALFGWLAFEDGPP